MEQNNKSTLEIDIVCPIYKNINEIKRICEGILFQKNVTINKVVFPHTLCGNEKIDNEIERLIKKYDYIYFQLTKEQFSHSLTREKAVMDYCESNIVVFVSQDVVLLNEYSLFNLAKNIDDDIIYAYGRQICANKSIEKYIRQLNYGDKSLIVDNSMIDSMQIMAFFASDAFSAINRNKFIELNGYHGYNVMMNEDQLYSKFVLDSGYKKMYVSDALVEHSHKYKLSQLYNRYRAAGNFYKKVKMFDKYKSNTSGIRLSLYVLKQALKHFDIPVLIRWMPDMLARYFGMKKGKKEIK